MGSSVVFRRAFASVGGAARSVGAKTGAKTGTRTADVTIIGAGPAGLSLAAGLKSSAVTQHLQVAVVESMPLAAKLEAFYTETPAEMTNRVVSLTPQTVDQMRRIGAWEWMRHGRVQSYDEMVVVDGVSGARLEFASDDIATMAETVNIQSALYQRVRQLAESAPPPVEFLDGTKVERISRGGAAEWPLVELDDGTAIQTRLLVGCDGANSPVRTFAGIAKRGWAYNRWGVVATLHNEFESFKLPTAWQRFLPTGPVALLPLPDNGATLVWSTTPELSTALIAAPHDVFVAFVNAAFRLDHDELDYLYGMLLQADYDGLRHNLAWRQRQFAKNKSLEQLDDFPVPVADIVRDSRARFPLRLSHADTYVADRVALVGDAAHTVHPLAGQGLNLGQQDVASLVAALETGVRRGLDIGSPLVLEPYFSDSFPRNHAMLGVCDKLHKVYTTDSWPVVAARTFGVNLLNQLPFVKELLVQNVSRRE